MTNRPLSWSGVFRLGLVQCALGAMAALTTSTLNRVMVVEEAMPAILPAAFVAWHYVVQLSRPRWGHGSDRGGRRTPFIIVGMGAVVIGAMAAVDATSLVRSSPVLGIVIGLFAYTLIGAGVGASGTSLLALLASRVVPERRAASASITWILMIFGIVLSAGFGGHFLQPFSPERLALVVSTIGAVAFLVTLFAVRGAEPKDVESPLPAPQETSPAPRFSVVLRETLRDPVAGRFTLFVFISMLAYSAEELVLEPFAGLVLNMNPGQSTQLSSVLHAGSLIGMILVGVLGARFGARKGLWMRLWTILGCIGSAAALAAVASLAFLGLGRLEPMAVMALGFANGVFAVAAIGSMMGLAGAGASGREGVRMGVWGAAQAGAFALGGLTGAVGVDVTRALLHDNGVAFAVVFALEALCFVAAATLAARASPAERTGGAPIDAGSRAGLANLGAA
jgi:BCD family chlorophyll transporter-like MFS transporter